ncbi:MAG TPA: NAD(P)-dependent oxidoreductase [Gammaproteobacteria bacterium]|nr:NAD(P)-dependent oxidoreductase [Gammaproteobacteria bacterium]
MSDASDGIRSVAFLGLGAMGYPMAGHVLNAGYEVTVYNRTTDRAQQWAEQYDGFTALTPAIAAADADVVCACVGNDDDLRSIVLGADGAFAGMRAGSIFIDHTTASADVARELAAVGAKQDIHFLDAPISGGQIGAEHGSLTIMVGGDQVAFVRTRELMRSYGHAVTLMGEVGAGQLTKMVNQICIAGIVQGLSEGLNFAVNAGLDAIQVIDVIAKGAAQSWQMENRGKTMVAGEFDFGFATDWMRKDLGLCLQEARRNGARLPLTALVDQFYAAVQQRGDGRMDSSSLISLLNGPKSS